MFPVVYDRAEPPTGGPRPGAIALMNWALGEYDTATNLGIYNPRRVRGGRSWSVHASGRAIDIGFPYTVGGTPQGHACAQLLVDHSAELGIQQVIYSKRIWRNTIAARGWRPYNGTSPHYEHVHAELTIAAGDRLDADTIRNTLRAHPILVPDDGNSVMDITDYIRLVFWNVKRREPDYAGQMFWLDRFSAEHPDRAAWSRNQLADTKASADMIYGLENEPT